MCSIVYNVSIITYDTDISAGFYKNIPESDVNAIYMIGIKNKYIMKMIKQCITFLVMTCACNVQAQAFHMSDLVGKTWKGTSGYIGVEFFDQYLQLTETQAKEKIVLKKDGSIFVSFTYDMYLSDSIPDKFDETQIGRNNVGKYLILQRIWDHEGKVRVVN